MKRARLWATALLLVVADLLIGCATRVRFDPAPDVIVIWGSAEICEAPDVCSKGAPISDTFAGLLRGIAELAAEVFGDGPPPEPPTIVIGDTLDHPHADHHPPESR